MILNYNYQHQILTTDSGSIRSDLPIFGYVSFYRVTVRVLNDDREPVDLSAAVEWRGALADKRPANPPMARIMRDDFDLSRLSSGELSFVMSCYTVEYMQSVANKGRLPVWLELYGIDNAGRQIYPISIQAIAVPIVDPAGGEPLPVPNSCASQAWVIARDHAAPETQYSADGVVWSDDPELLGAVWYRWRKPNVDGEWSERIPLPRGETGAAATFAIVKTDTLPPGAPATVTEAEGSTSGARKYIVGVPEGRKGDKGDTGAATDYNPILSAGNGDEGVRRRGWLGDDADTMTFYDDQYNVTKVLLRVVSANAAITGNIVLVPSIDGVDQPAVVVPVGATVAPVELPFAGVNGRLSIRRDWQDNRDTLREVTPVGAKVVAWEVHHG